MCDENRIVRPCGRHRPEQRHHVQPLARVHAVERLVEEQDPRLVDERAGELRPLAHALGVRADRPVRGVGQVDRRDRPGAAASGSATPWRRALSRANSRPRQERVDGLALGDETDVAVHLGAAPGALALDQDAAGRRREQAGHQVEERRLAGAVRAEESGHAGSESERDVVDRDDVAVPARDVIDLERGRRPVAGADAGGWTGAGTAGGGGGTGSGAPGRRTSSSGAAAPSRRSCRDPQVAPDGQADRRGDADGRGGEVGPAGQVDRGHDRAVRDRPEDRRVRAVEDVGRAEQDDDPGEVLARLVGDDRRR